MEKGSLVTPLILILAVGLVGYLIINSQKPVVVQPSNTGTSNGGWFNSFLQLGTAVVNKVGTSSSGGGGSSNGRTYSGAGDSLMEPNF